ncbi:hypothetical protein Hanom_Chr16g01513091 [Helianthus anomalus]
MKYHLILISLRGCFVIIDGISCAEVLRFIRARIANIGGPRYMYSGFREGKGQNGETKLRLGFESYMNYSS